MSKTTIYCPKCGKEWDWTISEDPHERAYFEECYKCAAIEKILKDLDAVEKTLKGLDAIDEALKDLEYDPECSPGCLCDPECSPGCCELEDPMKAPRGIVTGLAIGLAMWVAVIVLAVWSW